MIRHLYCIYDMKAKIHHAPSPFYSHDEAKRWFELLINDKERKTIFQTNPFDFQFFYIGSFNDSDGLVMPLDGGRLELICSGSDVYVPPVALDSSDDFKSQFKSLESMVTSHYTKFTKIFDDIERIFKNLELLNNQVISPSMREAMIADVICSKMTDDELDAYVRRTGRAEKGRTRDEKMGLFKQKIDSMKSGLMEPVFSEEDSESINKMLDEQEKKKRRDEKNGLDACVRRDVRISLINEEEDTK